MTRVLMMVALALALAGCGSTRRVTVEVVTEDRAPLRLGVPQADEPARVRAQFAPLLEHLSETLGRKVELSITPTYKSVGWLLEQGKIELAWYSGVAFARVSKTHPSIPLARGLRFGRATYLGWLVVRADSPIQGVADLKGKRLAYVDPEAGSGFVAVNQILLDAGLSPGADLAEATFTYSHQESLQGVASGKYDAAGVFENAPEIYKTVVNPSTFRLLAQSQPLPNDVVACSPDLDPKLRDAIKRALLTMADSPKGQRRLAAMYTYGALDGFIEVR